MLPIPKIFINVISRLPALKVLNFQSSSFLKALKYTESRNCLQILPGIKFGAATKAVCTLLLEFLILMSSFIYRESSELVDRRYDSKNTLK